MKKSAAREEARERLWANLTKGRSVIPGSGIPSDWSILTGFVNTRALLTQMRYTIYSIMGAKIWNSIPENLQNSSKSLFKEKVHAILLKIFEVQDRYADLNTIISDFKNY